MCCLFIKKNLAKVVMHWAKYGAPHTKLSNGEDVECIGETNCGSTFYANVDGKSLRDLDLRDSCRIEWMYLTSWPAVNNQSNISCADIRDMLLYGFELSWALISCKDLPYKVVLDDHNRVTCYYDKYNTIQILLGNFKCVSAILTRLEF